MGPITSNRRGAAVATLIVMCALGALVALGIFDAPAAKPTVYRNMTFSELSPAARAALEQPAFRAYSNFGGRLPPARASFYREHRIVGVDDKQRIIRSEDGVVYFTRDDFRTVYTVR